MILYFSGTGNSRYTAERIGHGLEDETLDLFEKIRDRDYSTVSSARPWVVVVPTYAWRIPRIVQNWLSHTRLQGSRDIYFVMTCGGDIGNAGSYCEKLCRARKLNYRGCMEIVMPENYIAMFDAPQREEALAIIQRAGKRIDEAIQYIRNEKIFPAKAAGLKGRLNSGIVNDIFYPAFVHAKKFYATDGCISCGKCEKVCPLNNIQLQKGRPVWGKDCTHCMACISRCPKEAIEYGKHTKGLVRYTFPE